MNFQKIVAPTITELFERQMQGVILSGQVTPGEKLPTEAELAESMNISKSAVGVKAILILEKHNMPGGLATDYVRNGFEMEASLARDEHEDAAKSRGKRGAVRVQAGGR